MAKDKSGFVVAAAFIGPGTIATASLAGANFGFHLVWALLFSVVATIVLQDMAARLGIATGGGLSDALTTLSPNPAVRWIITLLIVGAIGVGNAAYESGNLTGAAIGLDAFYALGTGSWALILGAIAAVLLWNGHYQVIERVLVVLVVIMASVFFITLLVASPDWSALISQFFAPKLDTESLVTVLALIGTTIVPYNLFLHASLTAKHYQGVDKDEAVSTARRSAAIAISFGGLITLTIIATAMTAFFQTGNTLDAGNMGAQLEPVLGEYAQWFFAAGLFAAGLTSAITAPLAAAFAVCGALQLSQDSRSFAFRLTWGSIIACGVIVTTIGFTPLAAILFAQAMNGLLLPIIAVFLLIVMNKKAVLGDYRNKIPSNVLGILIVSLVVGLGIYKLTGLFAG